LNLDIRLFIDLIMSVEFFIFTDNQIRQKSSTINKYMRLSFLSYISSGN